jgi:hypothetical protein
VLLKEIKILDSPEAEVPKSTISLLPKLVFGLVESIAVSLVADEEYVVCEIIGESSKFSLFQSGTA